MSHEHPCPGANGCFYRRKQLFQRGQKDQSCCFRIKCFIEEKASSTIRMGRSCHDDHLKSLFLRGRENGWGLVDFGGKRSMCYPKIIHNEKCNSSSAKKTHKRISRLPSGWRIWHQLLDKTDSYYAETSATAIFFTYCIAHAINKGMDWIRHLWTCCYIGMECRINQN